jgi:DNA-binding XRE family transcriptional regulator
MAQADLVAKMRAYRAAERRYQEAREELHAEIRRVVAAKEWQIVDIAQLMGVSRETVRAIAKPKPKPKPKQPGE